MRQKGFAWVMLIIFIAVAAGILVLTAYQGRKNDLAHQTKTGIRIDEGKDGKGRAFTDAELESANAALAKGITIEDPQNDWYNIPPGTTQPDGRPDNSEPYPIAWTDYRSLSVGADENYIYFKYRAWGEYPKKQVVYNGDALNGGGVKVTQFTFVNSEGKTDSADLDAGPWYGGEEPFIGAGATITPIGLDKTMDTIFKINTSESMVAGGPGYDYFIFAFPLKLFNLKLGDTVIFDSSTETNSTKFHHEAIDLLLGEPGSKFGSKIEYTLGASTYKIIKEADYSKHS